ncbi:unnamed protein product [Adineta ricciae]|uniref:Major facilitator superfamily (MFS) profile domain-containing protein n=2 Tax=Adineta ricciae TaxID=249248 RepID=A0A814WEL9_ADIRI|nr:unnamed protein product [Adineta ricciae]
MTKSTIVVDSARGWWIVFASFMVHFIMDGITYSMAQVFLEPMRKNLSLSRAAVSSIFSILPAITLGAGPIASVLINMFGCRAVAIIGTCIASFGFFLSYWWANIWFYYVTIGIVGGLGFALMYLAAIVSVNKQFKLKLSTAMGIAVCGSGVGTFVLSYIMDGIVNIRAWVTYPYGLLIEAGIITFGVVCGLLLIPKEHEIREENVSNTLMQSNGEANPVVENDQVDTKSTSKSFFKQIRDEIDLNLFRDVAFNLFVFSNFLTSLGFNVIYNFADDLASDAKVVKDLRTYIVMSIGLSNIVGRIVIGFLDDRKLVNRLLLFILTLLLSGIATIVAPLCGSSVISHIGYASVFGFFSGGYVTLTTIVLGDIIGVEKISDGSGILFFFVGVATAIGTPIVGAMRDAFSHFARPFFWPYVIFGVCTVVSGILLFAIPLLQKNKRSTKKTPTVEDSENTSNQVKS